MGKYCNEKGPWRIDMCLSELGIVPVLHTFTSVLLISSLSCNIYFHPFINEDGADKRISSQINSMITYELSSSGTIKDKNPFTFTKRTLAGTLERIWSHFSFFSWWVIEEKQTLFTKTQPVFVNKNLLKHDHKCSLIYCLPFYISKADLRSCD